jgi:hypothetical protein
MDARRIALRFRAATSGFLLMLVAASASQAAPDARRGVDDSRISVTAVAGQVDVTMAGEAVTVERDATVLLPARIVTGHDGTLGLTQAGTNITVSSDTDIEIPAEAVDGNLVARLVQHRGNVFYDVAPRDIGKLRVETPFLVAVIKGTQFNVAVGDDRTTISLFEGSLELRTPDDSNVFELNAGEIAIRSLIDDSIQIVGMNDERVDARAPEPVAEQTAAAAAPAEPQAVARDVVAAPAAQRPSESEHRAAPANAALAAAQRETKESVVATTGIEVLSVADTTSVEPGSVFVALDRRNEHARGRGAAFDLDLEIVEADLAVDTEVDLGGALDLQTDPTVDATLDLGVDTGPQVAEPSLDLDVVTPSLDLDVAAPSLDLDVAAPSLDLDVVEPILDLDLGGDDGAGTVDVKLPDLGKPLPVPTPSRALVHVL